MKKYTAQLIYFFLPFLLFISGCDKQQLNTKSFTVGVVNLNHKLDKVFNGFKDGLAELGYQEGSNIDFIYNGSRNSIQEVENDLVTMLDQNVDLILAITTPPAKKAKQLTIKTGTPVVFAPVFDPVKAGIVESMMEPGGNLTGIKVGGNAGKALEWLLIISPEIKNILVPLNRNNQAAMQSLIELQKAAETLNVALQVSEIHNKKELSMLLKEIPSEVDAIWLLNSHFLVTHTPLLVEAAKRFKLPLASGTSQVEDGVLLCYGQNALRTGELAAGLAHKILQGSHPNELPVETTDFFLSVNLKTAEEIGIDIADDVLLTADIIIRP